MSEFQKICRKVDERTDPISYDPSIERRGSNSKKIKSLLFIKKKPLHYGKRNQMRSQSNFARTTHSLCSKHIRATEESKIICSKRKLFHPFLANVPILYPLKALQIKSILVLSEKIKWKHSPEMG